MLSRLNKLPTDQGFPANSEFYVFQEVIDQNDGAIKVDEYYDTGQCEKNINICMKPFNFKMYIIKT